MTPEKMTHHDIYLNACSMRSEVQAELIMRAFAALKNTVKSKVPAFGPLYNRANYKLCMKALDKQSASA
ncbi:MAG: hypothetical protein KBT66_06740 [Amphritea sp.]|nr:hypothetical protein [Amphritea sp.]MBQ0783912.1 hypothetical protein [Amphritea sp.]